MECLITISYIDTLGKIIWNVAFNVGDNNRFPQLINRRKVTLQQLFACIKTNGISAMVHRQMWWLQLEFSLFLAKRTWDGSKGWSTYSNTESTNASKILAVVVVLMVLETSIRMGSTCLNSPNNVCWSYF